MKHFAAAALMLTGFSFAHFALAEEVPANQPEIPTAERDFVKAINGFDKAKIIAQFGEPAKAEDVKIKDTTKVVASIWHYHYINTAPDGTYYQTTELDFIDDKVVMVVFMNNDGSDSQDGVKRYEMPDGEMPNVKPEL